MARRQAAVVVGLIDRAFDALQAENIGAYSVLAEKRMVNGVNDPPGKVWWSD